MPFRFKKAGKDRRGTLGGAQVTVNQTFDSTRIIGKKKQFLHSENLFSRCILLNLAHMTITELIQLCEKIMLLKSSC